MVSLAESVQIGPFVGGLNTYSDDSSVADNEVVECLNFELDLDGSLKSRPPFVDLEAPFPLDTTGDLSLLGYYTAPDTTKYLIASDGNSSTYYFTGSSWTLITDTFAASAMTQFDGKAWLVAPVGSPNPGGYWEPVGGFSADNDMPKGDVIVAYKFRLWIAAGRDATSNGTRLWFSELLGDTPFWDNQFIDIGAGDGQNIVQCMVYFNSIIIFRTDSVYALTYNADPSSAQVALILAGIGLTHKDCLVTYENYMYFMYQDRAYEFYNNRATQINIKVPFEALSTTGFYKPLAVSIFNNRVIYSYYDTMYVFGLKTRTWTRWRSTEHGPIGKIIETADTSFRGIAHPSLSIGPSETLETNLLPNPSGRVNATGYSDTGGDVVTTQVGDYTYVAATGSSPFILIILADAGTVLQPDTVYTFSADIEAVGRDINLVAAGTVVGGNQNSTVVEDGAGFERVSVTFTTPSSFGSGVILGVMAAGTGSGGDIIRFRDAILTMGDEEVPYFDGSTPASGNIGYRWTGTPDESSSEMYTIRQSPILQIVDGFSTAKEAMTCVVQTKNYDYEAAAVYKKLLWWGINTVMRGEVTGVVTPITFNFAVTWGQLLETTWGSLNTWGQPTDEAGHVSTIVDLEGSGSMRKFIKFPKTLRFRQVNFRLEFESDGSTDTSPVRLFSIMTRVRAKQLVAKQVT